MWNHQIKTAATQVVDSLVAAPETISTAESLTGGLLSAALTMVPGASKTFRGGVSTYATATKTEILDVSASLLVAKGAVDSEVAKQMAQHTRELFNTDWAIATTGVAGPEPQDGQPVGTVFIAVANETTQWVKQLNLNGTRNEIRLETVLQALELFAECYK